MYQVRLFQDNILTDNVKYRNATPINAVWSSKVVSVGNFANKNIFVDNSVELSVNYMQATTCNFIAIGFNGKTIIGKITDFSYINDNNTNISYRVDTFSSARTSGIIEQMNGLCERVNMSNQGFMTNLQSEPFSPSDQTKMNVPLTDALNSLVWNADNFNNNGLDDSQAAYILTVSPTLAAYLGETGIGANPFITPPPVILPILQMTPTLNFNNSDTRISHNGVYRGIPVRFNGILQVSLFLRQILSGCGFVTIMPPNGWTIQNRLINKGYVTNENTGAGQQASDTFAAGSEIVWASEMAKPYESIRFITLADIYGLQVIPWRATTTTSISVFQDISGFTTTANLHRWGGESSAQHKLMAYPYKYYKIKTIAGDLVNIYPQQHFIFEDMAGNPAAPRIRLIVEFIGGDTPRLVGRLLETSTIGNPNEYGELFTIRNYPSITLSINDSFNPQLQRDTMNNRQLSASFANARLDSQARNPIRQGYLDGVAGEQNITFNNRNSGMGDFAASGNQLGGMLGRANVHVNGGARNPLVNDRVTNNANQLANTLNANALIEPMQGVLSGTSFVQQTYEYPTIFYECGATDTELFAFSRYLEEFGASCGCHLNPLTNSGNLFGGEAGVITFNGRTFYQYGHILIQGVMPPDWKLSIKALFESGVYLQ